MSIDPFKRILMNAGEQAIASDINNLQRQFHMHLFEMLKFPRCFNMGPRDAASVIAHLPWMSDAALGNEFVTSAMGTDVAWCPFPHAGFITHDTVNARSLIVGSSPGPICQLLDNGSMIPGSADFFLTYWMQQDEQTLVTAVGDATNPRIDVVEMKLELDDRDAETRVYGIAGVKAELDLDPTMANVDTVIEARVAGEGGNNISIEFVADGAGAGSLTQSGWALTFHFEATVTTVTDFETAVAASALIQVKTPGTGANIFASPGDVEPAVFLEGGVDTVLASQSIDKARRVVATFQIKQGTPDAAPAYPSCTAGFVPVAAVYVPATHNTTHSVTNMRDMRVPLGGVRPYDLGAAQLFHGDKWERSVLQHALVATDAAPDQVYAYAPVGGGVARLVGLHVHGVVTTLASSSMRLRKSYRDSSFTAGFGGATPPTLTNITNHDARLALIRQDGGSAKFGTIMIGMTQLMDDSAQYVAGTRPADTRNGTGVWSNGEPGGPIHDVYFENPGLEWPMQHLALEFLGDQFSEIHNVRMIFAHGIG